MIRFLPAALPGRTFGIVACIFTLAGLTGSLLSYSQSASVKKQENIPADSMPEIASSKYSIPQLKITKSATAELPVNTVKELPYTYLGQALNGRVSGVTVLRNSGEPGVAPAVLIRGATVPIGSYADLYDNQPLYVVNGVPLIANNHPYPLAIKQFDLNGIGSGIDINTMVDMNNVTGVEVLKGAEAVAQFGAQAANGAILITTAKPVIGKYRIGLNVYGGVAVKPSVNTGNSRNIVNAAFQRDFVTPFYNKYATAAEWVNFPAYLMDSTQQTYYGAADWDKLYYRNVIQHGLGVNISGGNDRANFRFGVGEHTENGVADNTSMKRYNVYYDMLMVPIEKLIINTFVQASTARRDRNRSMRERYAEQEYFPNQQLPLSPNKTYLQQYYSYLDQGIDDNNATALQVKVSAQYELSKYLSLQSQLSADYNDNQRNLFVPAALNEGNSFNSYFTGINRRVRLNNFLLFNKELSQGHTLGIQVGQTWQSDQMKYDYIRGYRGPSDFIKLIQVNLDPDNKMWITHDRSLVYRYKDYLKQNLLSFYGHATYDINKKYSATFSLRSEGSSYFANGYHWAVSPVLALNWDLKQESWLQSSRHLNALTLKASGGRTARLPVDDFYGYGPYYTVDIGWLGNEKISSYASFPTLSMPYSKGYIGGGINWPYTNQWDAGVSLTAFNFLDAAVNVYSKTSKDLLVPVPVDASYGYTSQTVNGMDVRNSGVEATLQGNFKLSPVFKWTTSIVMQYNSSKLLKLPNNLQAINYGNRRLQVGKATDQFWLLQNEGIYTSDNEIPVSTDGKKLTYNGIALHAGDPKWKDVNHDFVIDDNDRVMQDHVIPPVRGGWNNTLQYKNWSLDLSFLYAMGNHLLNGDVANRFNFVKREGANGMDGVKEVTFWSEKTNLDNYPRYNPWSKVDPYQVNQSLFLEKAAYLKLQAMTLRYDLSKLPMIQQAKIRQLQVYLTGSNLFTLTPYSGYDPSLADYYGYDYGYAQPLPMTFSFGVNIDF
jgi:TonB-linked SusC/RagA family outer membrane protein